MKSSFSKILIVVLAGIGLFSPLAVAVERAVDCDKGQSIQSAVNKGMGSAEQLIIYVSGLCEENVYIERDNVTINGNNNATVSGQIELRGADRIAIHNITVTGPGIGIAAYGSNLLSLSNVTVTGNQAWTAIIANESSSLTIYDSNISGNSGIGIFVGLSSSLVTVGNTFFNNNSEAGVQLSLNSSAFLTGSTSVEGNSNGISAHAHSIVDLENVNVSNNINNGINLWQDGAAILRTGNTISGNGNLGVYCFDSESSYSNQGAEIADSVDCTGFDQVPPELE